MNMVPDTHARRIKALFHRLWGNAATGEYDKQLWGELQLLLNEVGIKV